MDGRARARKAGALVASCLAGAAATLALATPAYAEDADLRMEIRSGQLNIEADGDPQNITVAVTNNGPNPVAAPVANFEVPLGGRGVTIGNTSLSCAAVNGPNVIACQLGAMNPGQTIDVTVEIKPPGEGTVQPGENVSENGNAWVSNPAGGDPNNSNDGGSFNVVLTAGEQGGEVNEVSGQVVDGSSGEPLAGATVEIADSTGRTGSTTTDSEGRFNYRAEPALQAGRITIKATKDGYDPSRTTVDANGGSINDVQLAVSKAEAVPSPTPSAAPSSAAAAAPQALAKDDDDSSSLLVVILVSVIATTILAGAALWIGLRRNRDHEPAYANAGGFQPPPMRPATLDAPTVQLRLPGAGGTRMMPTLGAPEVDATQQIPMHDNTHLMPPGYPPVEPVAYDQTAPFGPPPGQPTSAPPFAGQPTSAPPFAGQPTSAPPFAGQPTSAPPFAGQPTSAFSGPAGPAHGSPASPPPFFGQPTSAPPSPGQPTSAPPYPGQPATPLAFSGPPAAVPPPGAHAAPPQPSPGDIVPPPTAPFPANPAPDLFAPLPDAPLPDGPLTRPYVAPPAADSRAARHTSPPGPAPAGAAPEPDPAAKYRGPLDPAPPNTKILRITPSTPPAPAGPSPLSTQSGGLPPITALQAPVPGSNTHRPAPPERAEDEPAPRGGRHSGPPS